MKKYRSPYEAYPFLSEDSRDLRCDFEILTDRLASQTGLLASMCPEREIKDELIKICGLIYHMNPSLRTFFSIEKDEINFLIDRVGELRKNHSHKFDRFVLPQGSTRGSLAHLLRADAKALVRLIYRYGEDKKVEEGLIDFANLLSGYFFLLALELNSRDKQEEIEYVSRNYK